MCHITYYMLHVVDYAPWPAATSAGFPLFVCSLAPLPLLLPCLCLPVIVFAGRAMNEWTLIMRQKKALREKQLHVVDYRLNRLSPASRRGRDKHCFHTRGTNPLHFAIVCFKVTCCHMLRTFCPHFPMNVHYRESRHFCEDPICPDPVWKLSRL